MKRFSAIRATPKVIAVTNYVQAQLRTRAARAVLRGDHRPHFLLSFRVRCVLYRAVHLFADSGDASGQTRRRSVRATHGRRAMPIVRSSRASRRLFVFDSPSGHVRRLSRGCIAVFAGSRGVDAAAVIPPVTSGTRTEVGRSNARSSPNPSILLRRGTTGNVELGRFQTIDSFCYSLPANILRSGEDCQPGQKPRRFRAIRSQVNPSASTVRSRLVRLHSSLLPRFPSAATAAGPFRLPPCISPTR